MKKAILLSALCLIFVFALAACGGTTSSSMPASSAPISVPTQSEVQEAVSSLSLSGSDAAVEAFVEGTVTDKTDNSLTIETPTGQMYTFDTSNLTAASSSQQEVAVGDFISVYYVGVLTEDEQDQPVTVSRVEVSDYGNVSSMVADVESAMSATA